MPVSEAERMELVGKLTDAIGKEAAETLMACVLPDGRDQLATKADLEGLRADSEILRAETKAEFGDVRSELEVLRSETNAGFSALRSELEVLRSETNAGFSEMRSFMETKLARQARLHYGSLAAFILSGWGVIVTQTFVM